MGDSLCGIGMKLSYTVLIVRQMLFNQVPKTFLMVLVFNVCQFMYDDILYHILGKFHHHCIEAQNIFPRTTAPLSFGFTKTYACGGESHLPRPLLYKERNKLFSLLFVEIVNMLLKKYFIILLIIEKERFLVKDEFYSFFYYYTFLLFI